MELKEREDIVSRVKVSYIFYALSVVLLLSSLSLWFFYENSLVAFFIFILSIFIMLLTYIDTKREEQKNIIIKKLQKSNIILQSTAVDLEIKSQKIGELNSSLESRVQEEVAKNRAKDMQLIEQTRLAQMGELMSMIAHQWRQPLASIGAASTALNLKAELDKISNELVLEQSEKIVRESQELSDTIDKFSRFFKQDSEKKRGSFKELIEVVTSIIGDSLQEKTISLIEDIESSRDFVSYPNELKQVILNLIKNAEDMLVEKGVENPFIKLTVSSENSYSILKVSDNAGGISETIIESIFDPYFSTKYERTGRGLGLYMSKMIIEEHCHGILSVENSKSGAVFTISIKEDEAI